MRHHRFLVAIAVLSLLTACGGENVPIQITPGQNTEDGSGNGNGNSGQEVVATAITLDKHEIIIEKGSYETLAVFFTPENTTDKQLGWASLNKEVATVDGGLVVGVAPGVADIIVNHGNLTDKCQVTVVISATSVSLDRTELTLSTGETATLKATVLPEDSTDKVEWSSSDETIVTVENGAVTAVAGGDATITAKAGDKMATCSVKVVPAGAVDLGLSVYWAECNLGAEKPEEYGDYYAWGETEIMKSYSWSTYKYANGASNKLTKYCFSDKAIFWDGAGAPDNKTVLELEDDVAHVKLGGVWRMPTKAEFDELRTNCIWNWTTRSGVKGYVVTGSNGNSIFLPAAGYRKDTGLVRAGSSGSYWSSSLYTGYPYCACSIGFGSSNVGWDGMLRCDGHSVRPVTE